MFAEPAVGQDLCILKSPPSSGQPMQLVLSSHLTDEETEVPVVELSSAQETDSRLKPWPLHPESLCHLPDGSFQEALHPGPPLTKAPCLSRVSPGSAPVPRGETPSSRACR